MDTSRLGSEPGFVTDAYNRLLIAGSNDKEPVRLGTSGRRQKVE